MSQVTNLSDVENKAALRTVRFALIGFGIGGANFHAPVITSTPGCKVTAIVTANPERRNKAAMAFPEASLLDSAEQVWRQAAQFDVIVIASPNRTHVPFAEAAMKAGLAVVLDKPMAPTFKECQQLLCTSEKTGSLLTVFHNRRWDGDFLTIRQLIDTGTIGQTIRFESHFDRWRTSIKEGSWRESDNPEEAGGLLFDLGSHLIDQAICLFGIPLGVYAESHKRRAGSRVDDDTFIALHFAKSIEAHLWVTNFAAITAPRFRLYGTQGTFEKYGMDPQEELLKKGLLPKDNPNWGREPQSCWGRLVYEQGGTYFDGTIRTSPGNYVDFYKAVHDAIVNGASLPVPAQEAALVLRTIEAAKLSATNGQVVCLEPTMTI